MKRTKNVYHYQIRKCKASENKIKRNKLLDACVNGNGNLVYDIDMGAEIDFNTVRSDMVTVILKDGDGSELDRMANPILKSEFAKLSSDFTVWFIGNHIELVSGDFKLDFSGADKINEINVMKFTRKIVKYIFVISINYLIFLFRINGLMCLEMGEF